MGTALERLKLFISESGLTPRAFAIKIDFNYSTLNNYLTGRRATIDLDLIDKTVSSFENLSAEWLLRGKGEMLLTSEQPTDAEDRMNKLIDTITFQQDTIKNLQARINELETTNKRLETQVALYLGKQIV
ncbi:helix-turn-helix transcriptional regulator [uncultured Bacteroides sp.]|uniref:helix-turn-helix domain-containing protein n=1 Tax=uncultured Bacteroides sp. TaxID=162156 RepID=UPI002609BCCD|nr:helix-turn-helix transcriptional regulator [uncultured Bacteroides sp.]